MASYKNFDQTKFARSQVEPVSLKTELNGQRIKKMQCSYTGPHDEALHFSYAATPVSDQVIEALSELAQEQELISKYKSLLSGDVINTGENRQVLHHLTRGLPPSDGVTKAEYRGKDQREFYANQWKRVQVFCSHIVDGKIQSTSGKTYTHVCQIGIGGSDLGPRAMVLALQGLVSAEEKLLTPAFISNVDPDDATAVLANLPLESTLFVLVSKSGTTQETLANFNLVESKLMEAGIPQPRQNFVCVTSETSPLANNPDYLDSFYIDDFIGGRFSSTSAVGTLIMALSLGVERTQQFLDGAHQGDIQALEQEITKNPALLDALIGVYLHNSLKIPAVAILPYSQALSRFPAHIQQADMESNGKMVNRNGEAIEYSTGPVIFGEPGTNGQHSFYQLLHQGTRHILLQFIGFRANQRGSDIESEGSTSQIKLAANLVAQIVAFAKGQDNEDKNKFFPGERPSTLIYGEKLSPWFLGCLLSHYENRIMFQGFIWNLNSFDQEGVQLGKVLTKKVLGGKGADDSLDGYAELLGL